MSLAHLHLLRAGRAAPSVAIHATVIGCAVPLTLAFRNSLLWIIRQSQRVAGFAGFFVLAIVIAAVTVLLFLARDAETTAPTIRHPGLIGPSSNPAVSLSHRDVSRSHLAPE